MRRAGSLWMRLPLVLLLLLLTGCAGPRYQSVAYYEPPADPQGRLCLERCPQVLQACQDRCRVGYQACLADEEPQAQAHYQDLLRGYEADLSRYAAAAAGYGVGLGLGWGSNPGWGWGGYGRGPWYDPWYPPAYYLGPPPKMPDRAREVRRYLQRTCGQDCGCQLEYDGCFLACGGRKTVEWQCVANCPSPGLAAPAPAIGAVPQGSP
ncbi:MAG: hypothetical protein MUF66_08960 [Gammaproteobacteria bacterium]|nr:hypothetical protein [Gammaproteobacteria bacterium]